MQKTELKTVGWTGRKIRQDRAYDNFEVLYSSASGWYVFNHGIERVTAHGLGSEENARKVARKASGRRKTNKDRKAV